MNKVGRPQRNKQLAYAPTSAVIRNEMEISTTQENPMSVLVLSTVELHLSAFQGTGQNYAL